MKFFEKISLINFNPLRFQLKMIDLFLIFLLFGPVLLCTPNFANHNLFLLFLFLLG